MLLHLELRATAAPLEIDDARPPRRPAAVTLGRWDGRSDRGDAGRRRPARGRLRAASEGACANGEEHGAHTDRGHCLGLHERPVAVARPVLHHAGSLRAAIVSIVLVGCLGPGATLVPAPCPDPRSSPPTDLEEPAAPELSIPANFRSVRPIEPPLPEGAVQRFGSPVLVHPGAGQLHWVDDGRALVSISSGWNIEKHDMATGMGIAVTDRAWLEHGYIRPGTGEKLLNGWSFVSLIDVFTGRAVWQRSIARLDRAAFSPRGDLLALTMPKDPETLVVNAVDGTERARLPKLEHIVLGPRSLGGCAADEPGEGEKQSGARLVAFALSGEKWLDVGSRTFRCDPSMMAFAGDALVTVTDEGEVRAWDHESGPEGGRLLANFSKEDRPRLAVSDSFAAVGTATGEVRLIAPDGRERGRLRADGPVQALALDPSGSKLAVSVWPGRIRTWDFAEGTELRGRAGHGAAIAAIAFAGQGGLMASADHAGQVCVWDRGTGFVRRCFHPKGGAGGVAFSHDGARLAASSGHVFSMFDVRTGQEVMHVRTGSRAVVRMGGSGRYHASGGLARAPADARFAIFGASHIHMIAGDGAIQWSVEASVMRMVWAVDGSALITMEDEGLTWRDPTSGRVVRRVAIGYGDLAISPVGAEVVAIVQGAVLLFDSKTGARRNGWQLDVDTSLTSAAWSPDGSRLVLTTRGDLQLIDPKKGTVLARLHPGAGAIDSFARDEGGTLITGHTDGTLLAWDTLREVDDPMKLAPAARDAGRVPAAN